MEENYYQPASNHHLATYYGLILAGSLGHLILLILTLCSKRVQKNGVLINFYFVFCITLWFDAILCWTGHTTDLTEDIPPAIRILNASIRVSGMVMNATSSFMVVLRIWSSVNVAASTSIAPYMEFIDSPTLVIIPWLLGIPFLIAHLVVSIKNPDVVIRTPYFCAILNHQLNLASVWTSTFVMFFLLVLALWTAVVLIRLRMSQKGLVRVSKSVDIQLASRILLFLYYSVTSVVILIQSIFNFQGFESGSTLTFAATGFVAFVIFLIQADVLAAFAILFGLKKPSPTSQLTSTATGIQNDENGSNNRRNRRLSLTVFMPPIRSKSRQQNSNNHDQDTFISSKDTSNSTTGTTSPIIDHLPFNQTHQAYSNNSNSHSITYSHSQSNSITFNHQMDESSIENTTNVRYH